MQAQRQRPIPDSYWIHPHRFLAGEYPGSSYGEHTRRKLRQVLEAGITFFLDLTEEKEYGLEPYAPLPPELANVLDHAVEHRRMPIPDMDTPTPEEMVRILDTIDAALEAGHMVYVHCYGGIGRTGTVVGCYLARHGMSGAEALDEIAHLRQGISDGWRRSPQTSAQWEMVRNWPVGG